MVIFVTIAIISALLFTLSFLAFDDIDVADALDFGDDGGSGWFSLRNILLFGVGFGAVGSVTTQNGLSTLWASAAGCGAGFMLYLVGVAFAYLMSKQESNSLTNLDTLTGQLGTVVLTIQNQFHVGEVQVGAQRLPARAHYKLEEGATVVVKGNSGFTLIVEKEG